MNELEWINGKIFGNVFVKTEIVRIDPNTGCIDGIIDASELLSRLPEAEQQFLRSIPDFVMNGIAHNPTNGEIYLTGKSWKYILTIKLENQMK